MKSTSKALGLMLLSIVSAAAIVPPALSTKAAHPLPAAGCHQPAEKNSPASPASASYVCCRRGHRTALVQNSFAGRDSGLQCVTIVETTATVPAAFPAFSRSPDRLSSASPPHPAPLRI
jgi:hypothetical protein